MAALVACFPGIYFIIGLIFVLAPHFAKSQGNNDAPPAFIGWFFMAFACVVILIGWTFAACVLLTGRFMAQRKHYMFCLVMAGMECMFMPIGTILGVFTIILLIQEPVKQLFQPAGMSQ